MVRKVAVWSLALVLINFIIESTAECLSEITRRNSIEYGLYEEPRIKWFIDILASKLLFWTLPYFILYYRFILTNGKAVARKKIRFAVFNLSAFWICVVIYLPFFPDTIVSWLNLNKPPSFLSKWLHSSIIALASGYVIGFLYDLIRERYLEKWSKPLST